MRRSPILATAAGVLVLGLVAYPVYAHCGKCASSCKAILKTMNDGQVTLASAIATAEKEAKGKAVGALAQQEKDMVDIDVYVLGEGDKLMLVEVDGKTGKVKKSAEAKAVDIGAHDHGH